jgi:integrase/recombinase XerD
MTIETKRIGRPTGQSDFLEEEEVQRILGLPKRNTREGLRDYSILLVLANTPVRKGELCSLKVGNLVKNGHASMEYVALKKRKDREKTRRVHMPISEDVYEALMRYLRSEYRGQDLTPDLPLFRTMGKHGPWEKKPLTPKSVDFVVRKYVRLAEIKKRVTPHSFRATYLTLRLDRGISPRTLQELACHESISSTERYLRTNLTRIQDGALALAFV